MAGPHHDLALLRRELCPPSGPPTRDTKDVTCGDIHMCGFDPMCGLGPRKAEKAHIRWQVDERAPAVAVQVQALK